MRLQDAKPGRQIAAIEAQAAARKGGSAALATLLSAPKSPRQLARISDDRWLSEMSRCVFQAGFNWKVVAAKWPRFEEVFHNFDVAHCGFITDEDLDALLRCDGIIRHAGKLRTVAENAYFLRQLAEASGSAAKVFANWPREDFAGLLWMLRKRGARLGGRTGQIFLRRMGVDGFILSGDVVRALLSAEVIDKEPTSKKDLDRVQATFNAWRAESGRPLTQISQILAFSSD